MQCRTLGGGGCRCPFCGCGCGSLGLDISRFYVEVCIQSITYICWESPWRSGVLFHGQKVYELGSSFGSELKLNQAKRMEAWGRSISMLTGEEGVWSSQSSPLGLFRCHLWPFCRDWPIPGVLSQRGVSRPLVETFNFLCVGFLLHCRDTGCLSFLIAVLPVTFIGFLSPLNVAALWI